MRIRTSKHTLIVGHCSDLRQQLNEVRQIISQEFRSNNNSLAGMVGHQGRAEELGLTLYPESRSSLGILRTKVT